MVRNIRILLVAAVGFLMVAGSAFAEVKPILIGTSVSLSGSYAASAKYALEGYQLFVEQINKRGGLLGRPVKLVYYDDRSDANTGVQLYEKLITADKVDLIVGPYSSGVTSAVSTVAEKHKVAMISPEAADSRIYMRGYKYNFQGITQAGRYMLGALALAKANGYKTLAMLGEDTAFPKASSEEVSKAAAGYGVTVVFNQMYPKGATDFSALLTKVKQLNPDMIIANSYLPDSQGIMRQCREQGVNVKLFAIAVGAAEPEFGNLGSTANYVFGATQWVDNMKTKGNTQFVKSYKEMFKRAPDYHSASNYAALQVLEEAVKSVGSLNQDKIAAAIAKIDMDTVFGRFKVDDKGIQVGYTSALLQWQQGKQVVVWPDAIAQGKPILPTPPWSARK